jgi:hypothetical protein
MAEIAGAEYVIKFSGGRQDLIVCPVNKNKDKNGGTGRQQQNASMPRRPPGDP